MAASASSTPAPGFRIEFRTTFLQGRAVSFPCDARGNVDIDALSESGRSDYLFARIMTRRERPRPEFIVRCQPQPRAPSAGAAAA